MSGGNQEEVGRLGCADRATREPSPASGLGPDGRVSTDAGRSGYIAGLMGQPSLPGTYVEARRRAYECGYDIGRLARLAERNEV